MCKPSSDKWVPPFMEFLPNLAQCGQVCWMGVLTLQLWELVMRFPVLNPREVQETLHRGVLRFDHGAPMVPLCRTSGVWWPTPTGPCCCWRISPFGASSDRPKDEWPHAPRRSWFRHGMGSKKGGSCWNRSGKIWSCQKSTSLLIASKILLMGGWTQTVFLQHFLLASVDQSPHLGPAYTHSPSARHASGARRCDHLRWGQSWIFDLGGPSLASVLVMWPS